MSKIHDISGALSSAEVIMIIKSQVSVSSLLLNIPKAKYSACTESNGSRNKKQSKDLCRGESFGRDVLSYM